MGTGQRGQPWKRLCGRFGVPLLIALALGFSGASFAQNTGLPSADQLQQLLGGVAGVTSPATVRPPSVVPQVTILEPVGQQPVNLPPSRLEQIMSQRAGAALRQFGYDAFGVGRPVTLPQAGATQDDYVLGAGDEIIVTLRGQENSEYRVAVNRDGQIVLPRLSPIPAAGRRLGELRDDISAAVKRAFVATDAFVTIGQVREISVYVTGQVNSPGVRTLTGLSSVVDAILVSGGVKKTGSLRNVRIVRGGREIAVDLYGLLTQRGTASSVTLTDGDRVIVPPLGRTVAVVGWVRQPGIYELAPGQAGTGVASLISLAGGFEVRGKYRLSVLRLLSNGQSAMTAVAGQSGVVRDSEILFVAPGAQQTVSGATLSGGTALAGQYSINRAGRLSSLLRAPGALGDQPYTLFGIVVRKDPSTLLRVPVAFTPISVINGSEDMDLASEDTIRIFSVNEARLLSAVTRAFRERRRAAEEALRAPRDADEQLAAQQQYAESVQGGFGTMGTQQFQGNALNPNQVQNAGGNQQALTLPRHLKPNDERQDIGELSSMVLADTGLVPQFYPRLAFNFPPGQNPTPDQLLQYQQQYGAQPQVLEDQQQGYGAAPSLPQNYYGQQPFQQAPYGAPLNQALPYGPSPYLGPDQTSTLSAPQNLQQQAVGPGEVPTNQEVRTFGQLSRQLGIDTLVLVHFMMDHEVTLNGAVHGPGNYLIGPSVNLHELVAAAGGTAQWADQSGVQVTSTMVDQTAGRAVTRTAMLPLTQDTLATYIVRPRDDLRFNEVFTNAGIGSVTVQGEVRHNGVYQLVRGEHLSDLLQQAGGLTDVAYPYGAIFLRRSAAEAERNGYRRAAQDIQNSLLLAMTRADPGSRIPAEAFTSMQTFIAQLRTQTPLGRITVEADPAVLAVKPQLDPLLEPGDVLYVPQRPSSVSVLGEVMQPGGFSFEANAAPQDYIERAGGYSQFADDDLTFVVLPDGTATKFDRSWLHFGDAKIPPGSAIVVPRDVNPLDLRLLITQLTQIFSQLAVTAASIAVISQNHN
jgi:protein involved in polysaccharide export with SLBB domain